MKIAVIGATGVLGRHTVPRLVERGHVVRAQVRDENRASARAAGLAALGAEIVAADLFDPASLAPVLEGCDAAMHLATAVPRPDAGGKPDWSQNDRIRREGAESLLAACAQAGVGRYVQQSIAMLHCGAGESADAWLDEVAPVNTNPVTQSAADMEALVRASGLDWRVLRGGAFYGLGTGRDEAWRDAAREGALKLPGDGSDYVSLIHAADMAAAVVAAVEAQQTRATWIACDDAPVTYRALYAHLAALEGGHDPEPGGQPGLSSFRMSNARLKRETGWRPAYPSWKSGIV